MKQFEKEMRKCIKLAQKGIGMTSPNPMVGCVIMNSANEIVSTGYHRACGEAHAERDALLKSGNYNGCTLVVNLEPCFALWQNSSLCGFNNRKRYKSGSLRDERPKS